MKTNFIKFFSWIKTFYFWLMERENQCVVKIVNNGELNLTIETYRSILGGDKIIGDQERIVLKPGEEKHLPVRLLLVKAKIEKETENA